MDDFFGDVLEELDYWNPLLSACENSIEQPMGMTDLLVQDRLSRRLERVEGQTELENFQTPNSVNWPRGYGRELSKTLSLLEQDIEGMIIPPPPAPPEVPVENPLKPGGYTWRENPLAQEGGKAFYPGLSSNVRYEVRGSKSGMRGISDEIYCWARSEYTQKDECRESGCQYWGEQNQDCNYEPENRDDEGLE